MAGKEANKGIRVFHVEDSEPHRRLARDIFKLSGIELVLAVGTVAQALLHIPEGLKRLGINYALLDDGLPDGTGQTVAQAIRDAELDITIVANSAHETNWGDINMSKKHRLSQIGIAMHEAQRRRVQ
jgi:CheY-like chemotaxis protein